MKNKSISKLGSGVAVAAIASLAMLGTAHADQLATDKAELGIYGINFSNLGPGGKSPEFDTKQYDMVNLGPLSATLWTPKRGAQGPMRDDESANQKQMQWRDIQTRLGPIGGSNTP